MGGAEQGGKGGPDCCTHGFRGQRSERGNITVVQVYRIVNRSEQNICVFELFLKYVTFRLGNKEE